MKSFISDLFRVGLSNLYIMIFGVGTSVLTARFLSPEQNGQISAILVYPSLFMVFGSLGIRQSTTYFVGKKIYDLETIQKAITQIWFFTSAVSMLVCYFLIKQFTKNIDDDTSILLSIMNIPFTLYNTYSSGIFLGKSEIKKFNRINWIPNLVTFVATFVLLYFFHFKLNGALLALFLGQMVIFIILSYKNQFHRHLSIKIEKDVIIKMLSLGIIYSIALLVSQLNYKIDVILLENYSNSYELGIYSKGTSIVQYLWQIPTLFSTIIFSRSATSKDSAAFSKKVCQLLRISLVVIGLMSLIIGIFSKQIILLLFGHKFIDSVPSMQILLPGVVLLTVFKVMNMDLAGKGKPWIALQSMALPLIFNVVLNLMLIPHYGSKGAAFSSLITYSLASFFFLHFYSRDTKIKIREILDFKMSDWEPIKMLYQKLVKFKS